jgi:hypothetical protein
MLREFLSKLFSPPRPLEEPRVQKEDFARLKQRIHEGDEPQEGCELPHGRLTEFHSQHTPLKRSVSMEASTSAHERYLQRNAARADNWAAFEEILHPIIETADLTAGSFIKPDEEEELASHPVTPRPQLIEPFLKPRPAANSNVIITARLVSLVELAMVINAQKLLLLTTSKSRIRVATLRNFAKKKHRHLNINLSQRVFKSWLCKCAALEITPAEALRALSASSLTEVRKRVAANECIPYECLWALATDPQASVRMCIAKNPNSSIELLEALSKDSETTVASTANNILSTIIGKS